MDKAYKETKTEDIQCPFRKFSTTGTIKCRYRDDGFIYRLYIITFFEDEPSAYFPLVLFLRSS